MLNQLTTGHSGWANPMLAHTQLIIQGSYITLPNIYICITRLGKTTHTLSHMFDAKYNYLIYLIEFNTIIIYMY